MFKDVLASGQQKKGFTCRKRLRYNDGWSEAEEKGLEMPVRKQMAPINLKAIAREITHIQQTGRPSYSYETEKVGDSFYATRLVRNPASPKKEKGS